MGDFHGHSRKCNVFMYGCERKATDNSNFKISGIPGFGVTDTMNFRIQEKIFPWLLKRNAPDAFSFAMSSFKVQKSKENTARVVCWREFGLINSFTLEASFGGPSEGANAWDLAYRGNSLGHLNASVLLRRAGADTTANWKPEKEW